MKGDGMERRTDEWTDEWMDGMNGWLTATPADKNEGRKGGETEIELIWEDSRTGLGWVGLGWMSEFSK